MSGQRRAEPRRHAPRRARWAAAAGQDDARERLAALLGERPGPGPATPSPPPVRSGPAVSLAPPTGSAGQGDPAAIIRDHTTGHRSAGTTARRPERPWPDHDGDGGGWRDDEPGPEPAASTADVEGVDDGPASRLWSAGRPGTLVLCVVASVAALLAAGFVWFGRPSVQPVPPAVPLVPAAATDSAGSSPSTTAPSTAEIVVAVVGEVATPGLVTLPAGSRVADAVAAAGGALPGADLTTVNLARVLVDGEQVAVGVPGATDGPVPGPAPGAAPGPAAVNLNTATAAELETLPGVGPVLAQRIVDWRTENGAFGSVEQLQEVSGIGPATFAELQDEVTV